MQARGYLHVIVALALASLAVTASALNAQVAATPVPPRASASSVSIATSLSQSSSSKASSQLVGSPTSALNSQRLVAEMRDPGGPRLQKLSPQHQILVRVKHNQKKVSLRGKNLRIYRPVDPDKTKSFGDTLTIRLDSENGQAYWILKNGAEPEITIAADRPLRVRGSQVFLNGTSVPQQFHLLPQQHAFDVIAELDLEKYLVGVLFGEVPSSWPLEALKAQAVAARSYAWAVRQQRQGSPFHVDASVQDQVFKHLRDSELKTTPLSNLVNAVQATKGQVLVDSLGRVMKSFFHADCGGSTTTADNVWADIRSPQKVVISQDKSCAAMKRNVWRTHLSLHALEKALGVQGISQVQTSRNVKDGRIHSLAFLSEQGKALIKLSGNEFREKLGFSRVKSTKFEYRFSSKGLSLEGRGFGHGVGLCQWGAKALADQGKNFGQILAHYYPGVTH